MTRQFIFVILALGFLGRYEFAQGQGAVVQEQNAVVQGQEAMPFVQGRHLTLEDKITDAFIGQVFLANSVHNPLGIEIEPANQALRKQLSLQDSQGLVVLSVPDESEGAKMELKAFDVLISVDQHQISSGDQLQSALKTLADKEVKVFLMREGKLVTLNAKLPTFDTVEYDIAGKADTKYEAQAAPQNPFRIGVMLNELEPALRVHLKLETEGLLISEVVPDSPAAAAGIQVNDVLVRCNDQPITTTEQLNQLIQEIMSNPAKLSLIRSGEPMEVEVTPRQEATDALGAELNLHVARLQPTLLLHDLPIEHAFVQPIIQRDRLHLVLDFGVKGEQSRTESVPFQAELDSLQTALDDLKAKMEHSKDAEDALQTNSTEHTVTELQANVSEPQTSVTEIQAIERVFAINQVLGKQRDTIPQTAGLSVAAGTYVTGLDAIDYLGTPQTFQDAFQKHRDAWNNSIEFLKRHDSLRGEMHELFDQIRKISPQQKEQLEAHKKNIMDTWGEVEKAAKPEQ